MGRYLGGHPALSKQRDGQLYVDESGLKVKAKSGPSVPWKEIHSVAIEGPEQVERRITATRLLLTGPLALGWRRQEKTAFVVVQGEFGEFVFQINHKLPHEARAEFAPWTTRVNPPERESETPTAGAANRIDQLRELGELRDRGILTDEEFTAEKMRILGGPDR